MAQIQGQQAHLNIRDIPRATLYRLKMAAAVEQTTVKALVLVLIADKLHALEWRLRGLLRSP